MVGLVTRRPVKKIKRGSLDSSKGLSFSYKGSFKVMFFVILGAAFLYLIFYAFKHTLFKMDYYIKKIDYSTQSLSFFDDPYLYRSISKALRSENYYVVKYFKKGGIVKNIQQDYPIVNDIIVVYKEPGTVAVQIDFHQPDFIAKTPDKRFGVYQEFIFPLYSGNTLGEDILTLDLPVYMSGTQDIQGLFFEMSQKDLLDHLNVVTTNITDIERILYVPGSLRIALFLAGNKLVYINLHKNVVKQVDNLLSLQKYYADYSKLRVVDLGSLDDKKIIIH